jgi:hypothetical protein
MYISNPAQTHSQWLAAFEYEAQATLNVLARSQQTARPMVEAEIRSMLGYLQTRDQLYMQYLPTAEALVGRGFPALLQQVTAARADLGGAIRIYSEMLGDAIRHQSNLGRIVTDARTEVTRDIMESNAHTRAVYDEINRVNNYVNEGVPYAMALWLARRR